MTAREYAKECGVEIVGKLTKKAITREEFNWAKGEMIEEKITFWIDEAGNEFHKGKCGWMIITADGGCI